ncbi:type III-B CRISPR module RAMP protein Cmr1 [Desulfitobacterium chlororespirans]|uniref:CRISPR-associated protein Cmr1 n=1 Tax=Desulfitobacterium chlororespirans DSM 11544 TaxID=1121395 RepID=A0A1M7TS36_9FIRM|nr:type III-B CRISPR module RAMP protein Cmr1 [Desulfitobacterium chlororespirans]SHN73535.1 CRISPR-associated protein Cmr1 [Desulfitobacterium chlororespirans DSM 11544]
MLKELNKTVYKCRLITPMFLYGRSNEPELRASSLKGAMRFWWRAINRNLSLDELRKKEASLFGSSNIDIGRSPVNLRLISKSIVTRRENLLPHKDKGISSAFVPGSEIDIILSDFLPSSEHTYYEHLLETTLLLGGIGKRVRRGFGSILILEKNNEEYVTPKNIEGISALIALVNEECEVKREENKLSFFGTFPSEYPYIETVEIGKSYSDYNNLLKKIGQVSHQVCLDGGSEYTGFAHFDKRLASPVYVSVIKLGENYHPLVTTLHVAFQEGFHPVGKNKQREFKEAIL